MYLYNSVSGFDASANPPCSWVQTSGVGCLTSSPSLGYGFSSYLLFQACISMYVRNRNFVFENITIPQEYMLVVGREL